MPTTLGSSESSQPGGCFGRGFFGIVALVFFAAGLGIAGTGVRSAIQEHRERSWSVVPCTITRSDVADVGRSESKYRWDVGYRYAYNGEEHTSSRFARDYTGSEQYSEAQRLQVQHPVGSRTECYVDPEHPAEAVLRHRGPGYLVLIPFGLVLGAFGLLPMLAVRRVTPVIQKPVRPTVPLSSKPRSGRGGAVLVFGIFALVGGLMLWFMFLRPLLQSYKAMQSWRQVPCTILSSRVASHSGSKSTTYSVDILYQYGVDDREYRSNRFSFFKVSSGGRAAKDAIVRQFPPGLQTVCHVNPADPADAVLRPQNTSELSWAWFPSIFFLIGLVGVVANVRRALAPAPAGRSSAVRFGATSMITVRGLRPVDPNRPLVLRPRASTAAKLIGVAVFALIWNGVISIFIWHVYQDWRRGSWPIPALFLIPFVLVGIGFLGAVVYFLLALLNPRITFTLARGAISVGEAADLQWEFAGRYDRIKRLTISLEAREEATYRRGTDTRTDTRVFATVPVLETVREVEIRSGRRRLQIPAGSGPTFHATHNNVRWVLKVRGEIPRWPDLNEESEIEVLAPPNARPAPLTPGVSLPDDTGDARLSIELQGGQTSFAPGETVRGSASWDMEQAPRSLELRLFWYTRGKGTTDVGVIAAVPVETPQQRGSRTFEFTLPDRPLSFSGQLVSLIWAIELIANPANRSQRVEIVVAPGGQELRLDAAQSSGTKP